MGNPVYGKGFYDGVTKGYSVGYSDGNLIGAIAGVLVTATLGAITWGCVKIKNLIVEKRNKEFLRETMSCNGDE